MKKMIKNLGIVIVAILLLSSCKKEDDVQPLSVKTDTTQTKNKSMDYYGTYYIARNTTNLGDDHNTNLDSQILTYDISKDSIVMRWKDSHTGENTGTPSIFYYVPTTTVGDTVQIYLNNILITEISKGVEGYDLIIEDYYQPSSSGLLWIKHYLTKM